MARLNDGSVAMPDKVFLNAAITKWEPAEEGGVYVYGKCTGPDLDLDEQIIDPEFARRALNKWFADWANVRQMHSTHLPPAGKGVALDEKEDGFYLKTHVVEPTAVSLVKAGVYQAYSIGISKPRIVRDMKARNGRVVDGIVSENSLVDFPANPSCKLMLAKRRADGEIDTVQEVFGDREDFIAKAGAAKVTKTTIDASGLNPSAVKEMTDIPNHGDDDPDDDNDVDDPSQGSAAMDTDHDSDSAMKMQFGQDPREAASASGLPPVPNVPPGQPGQPPVADGQTPDEGAPVDMPPPDQMQAPAPVPAPAPVAPAPAPVAIDPGQLAATAAAAAAAAHQAAANHAPPGAAPPAAPAQHVPPAAPQVHPAPPGAGPSGKTPPPPPPGGLRPQTPPPPGNLGKGMDTPYTMRRMHDALCWAYDPATVAAIHPLIEKSGIAAAIDVDAFHQAMLDAVNSAGQNTVLSVQKALDAYANASALRSATVLDEVRADLHKSFTDMYPNTDKPTPTNMQPGQFKRPLISGGRADDNGSSTGGKMPNVPADADTPAPGDFDRSLITAGHQDDAPESTDASPRPKPGQPGRVYYTNAAKNQTQTAMQALHDHISSIFPELCPMSSTSSGAVGGSSAGAPDAFDNKADARPVEVSDASAKESNPFPSMVKGKKAKKDQTIKKAKRRKPKVLNKVAGAGSVEQGSVVKAILESEMFVDTLTEMFKSVLQPMEDELATMRNDVEKLGAEPAPELAPFRGSLSTLNALEKRTQTAPIEEQREAVKVETVEYLARLSKSGDPAIRERANAELTKILGVPPAL